MCTLAGYGRRTRRRAARSHEGPGLTMAMRRIALVVLAVLLAAPPIGWSRDGVAAQDNSVRVAITSPAAGTALQGRVVIAGWAVDPTSSDGPGINPRDVQLWLGPPPSGYLLDYAQ